MKLFIAILVIVLIPYKCFAALIIKDHLNPAQNLFTVPDIAGVYYLQVKKILLKDSPLYSVARMIVLPSFEPEWMISINKTSGGAFELEYVVVNQQIYANRQPDKIRVIKKSVAIPKDISTKIQAIWERALLGTQYDESMSFGFDGTAYIFSSYIQGKNFYVGEKWTPAENTYTGALTHLGEFMRDYVGTAGDKAILNKIISSIETINNIK